jgi:hypothetical protein
MANIVDLAQPSIERAKALVELAKEALYKAQTQALLFLTEEFMVSFIKSNFIACVVYMAASNADQEVVGDKGYDMFENYITLESLTPIVPRIENLVMYLLDEENYDNDYFSLRVITGAPYNVAAEVMYSAIQTGDDWNYSREYSVNPGYDLFAQRMISIFQAHYNEIVKDFIEKSISQNDIENIEDEDDSDEMDITLRYIENNYDIQEGDD